MFQTVNIQIKTVCSTLDRSSVINRTAITKNPLLAWDHSVLSVTLLTVLSMQNFYHCSGFVLPDNSDGTTTDGYDSVCYSTQNMYIQIKVIVAQYQHNLKITVLYKQNNNIHAVLQWSFWWFYMVWQQIINSICSGCSKTGLWQTLKSTMQGVFQFMIKDRLLGRLKTYLGNSDKHFVKLPHQSSTKSRTNHTQLMLKPALPVFKMVLYDHKYILCFMPSAAVSRFGFWMSSSALHK